MLQGATQRLCTVACTCILATFPLAPLFVAELRAGEICTDPSDCGTGFGFCYNDDMCESCEVCWNELCYSGTCRSGSCGPVCVECDPADALLCPADIDVMTEPGESFVSVVYPWPVEIGGGCSVDIWCDPPPGSAFPIGDTQVTCDGDDLGIELQCSFWVRVDGLLFRDDFESGGSCLWSESSPTPPECA